MLAFNTDWLGESQNIYEIEDCLKAIADAGFSHVHWCHNWDGEYTYSVMEMLQIRGWMKKYNLKMKGIHATEGHHRTNVLGKYKYRWERENRRDYTSENEFNRIAGVELIKNRVDMAYLLDTSEIVLHMQLPYRAFEEDPSFRDRYYAQVCKSFDELEFYCKTRGVRLCMENLLGTPNEHQIYQFDLLFDRYDSDFLGYCCDTGHALVTSKTDCLELPKRYVDRMFFIHTSDNIGLQSPDCWEDDIKMTHCDQHRLPFEGKYDWDGFAKLVAQSPYEYPIVLEVSSNDPTDTGYLARARETGERLRKLVEDYRGAL